MGTERSARNLALPLSNWEGENFARYFHSDAARSTVRTLYSQGRLRAPDLSCNWLVPRIARDRIAS
jgi:hypothetical protein